MQKSVTINKRPQALIHTPHTHGGQLFSAVTLAIMEVTAIVERNPMLILMPPAKRPNQETLPVTKAHRKPTELTLWKGHQWILVRG